MKKYNVAFTVRNMRGVEAENEIVAEQIAIAAYQEENPHDDAYKYGVVVLEEVRGYTPIRKAYAYVGFVFIIAMLVLAVRDIIILITY